MGSTLANGLTLAATTFADGIAGLLFAGKAINTGVEDLFTGDVSWGNARDNFSILFDNEISNGLQQVNDYVARELPYYRTDKSKNEAWYEHLGSMDFWADGLLKNMGFTVGALYSGSVFTKGLKALHLLSKGNTLGGAIAGSLYSAVNEGRIEANHTMNDMLKNGNAVIEKSRYDSIQSIQNDNSLSEEEKNARI